MNRNRPPALTSPWKIGFFVSLLLVTTSIGVGFIITRNFDLSWSWIQNVNGNWRFDRNSFMGEMLPLAVLVPLLSLFSYFLITSAVRKYKIYLDSGLDYKHLLQSIKKIDDLQDEENIKTLGKYRELKDFLFKIRDRFSEREKALAEKEKTLADKEQRLAAVEKLESEAAILVGAIAKGPEEGFKEDLMLSLPEIKKIENAVRFHLKQLPSSEPITGADDIAEMMSNLRRELQISANALEEKLEDITAEFTVSENVARNLEEELVQLRDAVDSTTPPDGTEVDHTTAVLHLLEGLDEASKILGALGEETKGVAINTALKAGSSEGGTTELVQLADDVRDLAAKFNAIAQQYEQVGSQVRSAVQASATTADSAKIAEALKTVSTKVTLWIERAVVLSSHLNSFQEHYLDSISALEVKLGGGYSDDGYQSMQNLVSEGDEGGDAENAGHEPDGQKTDDFEVQGQKPAMFDDNAATAGDMPGLEKTNELFEESEVRSEDGLFADIPGQKPVKAEDQIKGAGGDAPAEVPDPGSGDMFEEIDTKDPQVPDDEPLAPSPAIRRGEPGEFVQSHMNLADSDGERAEVTPPQDVDVPATDEVEQPATDDVEQPATDDVEQPTPGKAQEAPAASGVMPLELESHRFEATKPASADDPAGVTEQPAVGGEKEEEIIDLYELGAVDYQPDGVHQNV